MAESSAGILPGWTGSRGDILRSLVAVAEEKHQDRITTHFQCRVTSANVNTATLTLQPAEARGRSTRGEPRRARTVSRAGVERR